LSNKRKRDADAKVARRELEEKKRTKHDKIDEWLVAVKEKLVQDDAHKNSKNYNSWEEDRGHILQVVSPFALGWCLSVVLRCAHTQQATQAAYGEKSTYTECIVDQLKTNKQLRQAVTEARTELDRAAKQPSTAQLLAYKDRMRISGT
jgi:hypothetical protein